MGSSVSRLPSRSMSDFSVSKRRSFRMITPGRAASSASSYITTRCGRTESNSPGVTCFTWPVVVGLPPAFAAAWRPCGWPWRPAVPVPPALLAALLADSGEPIGKRLDEAAQAEGLEPLDVLGPALMSLRDLIRLGIVRTAG